jgi:hypothetical protein
MKIKVDIPQIFEFLFKPARYKVSYGGRGSSKSWSKAQGLVIKSLESKCRILCTREIQNSIKESVHKLLADTIERMDLRKSFNITNNSIVCANGSEFIFMGLLRNVDQIKSTEGIDYCWVSEAHNVSEDSWDILLPTIRKENSEIWIDFNPRYEDDPTYQRWVVNTPPGCVSKLVNYTDNPYFPDVLKKEMEHDKKKDFRLYEQKWLGKPVGMGGRVWPEFDKEVHIKDIPYKDIADKGYCIMAMDPHSHYYPAIVWIALIPMNKRGNYPEDFHKHIYAEYPTFEELGGYYHDNRKKITFTKTLADLSKEIYAKDGIEYGIKVKKRAVDPRYAKGSGSWNWSTSTNGLVELFAKQENGGLQLELPYEKILDSQRQLIHAEMTYNKHAPINQYNEPRFSVSPRCRNVISSLSNHRLEEGTEKEDEKFKDFSDALRIGSAIIEGYEDPKGVKKGPRLASRARAGGSYLG